MKIVEGWWEENPGGNQSMITSSQSMIKIFLDHVKNGGAILETVFHKLLLTDQYQNARVTVVEPHTKNDKMLCNVLY